MKVFAPVSYFSDLTAINKMINSGIWHFKIIILMDEISEEADISAIKKILKYIRQPFSVIGRGRIRPYTEIVLLTKGCELKEVREKIDFLREGADSISLPDIEESLKVSGKLEIKKLFEESLGMNKKRTKISNPSEMGDRPDYWLKLPSNIVKLVLEEVDEYEKIAGLYEGLDLSCSENLSNLYCQNLEPGKYNNE